MGIVVNFKSYTKKSFGLQKRDGESFMEIKKMLEIEEKVRKILAKVSKSLLKSPYVDIVSIVQKDDFVVEPTLMNMETTGCIFINETKRHKSRLILVNKQFENPENEDDVVFKKSRFITAHEYGHYILHKNESEFMFAHRDTYHRTEPKELEADYFARSILMPLNTFSDLYDYYNEESNGDMEYVVYRLSQLFQVTRNKVNKRIEDMRLLTS